ncbi:MAG: type II toxin-antitoxin system prevent-host-death family antitoxin [Actinobacteria bacterium]|nr:type II toxin-antitoxin system prevent-host-death family antitoxin [Actinomycetota bacterium]MCL5445736.1 type II toxin-antitoxin system prevent-host-death family antitoxin [Actinomycetota bacterium]
MTRISVRELRRHAGRYLEQLKAGEVVEITERGKLVALMAPPAAATGRDRLIASGHLVRAKSSFRLPKRLTILGASGNFVGEIAERVFAGR